MSKISKIIAREILDSRGNPTIETSVLTDTGTFGTASVPSGSSIGASEDGELRDGDQSRYHGLGVLKSVNGINTKIANELSGIEIDNQQLIDQSLLKLNEINNQTNLGTNAIFSVSIACIKVAAKANGKPLFLYLRDAYRPGLPLHIPGPTFNIINGGKHGAGNLDFQEFHINPSTKYSYSQALQIASELYNDLKQELIHRGAIHSVGDEGGFAPDLFTNSDALELMSQVIKNSPYRLNQDVYLGIDVAANSFFKNGSFQIKDAPKPLDRDTMINFYAQLVKDYSLFSLEDPLDKDDFGGWSKLLSILPQSILLVGDDLIATDATRLKKAISEKSINTILVKPNQTGTVTGTIELMNISKQNNIHTIISHRSGETNDTFIADFAVGIGSDYTKFGAPVRGERIAKYNRLLEIEQYLSTQNGLSTQSIS